MIYKIINTTCFIICTITFVTHTYYYKKDINMRKNILIHK